MSTSFPNYKEYLKNKKCVITGSCEDTNSAVTDKVSNLKKVLSPSKIKFGVESDASDFQVKKN